MICRILWSFVFIFFSGKIPAQQIALTFDDAPTADGPVFSGEERTEHILGHLREHEVSHAAFFVITGNLDEGGRKRLARYTDYGHFVANHTHTHRRILDLGLQGYSEDITAANRILRPMRGFKPWFRYPFLDEGRSTGTRDSLRSLLQTLNLNNGYVTIDNYDWYLNSLLRKAVTEGKTIDLEKLRQVYIDHVWTSIRFYDSIARSTLGLSPKHVLLLHENDLTAYFLGDLLSHIKAQGWKIISPAEAYDDPIARMVPDVLFNGQGRVAAIAHAKGALRRDLVQESEDEAFLDALVEKYKVFK